MRAAPRRHLGRFHSIDSPVKTRFPTNEITIRPMVLGLDKDAPGLRRPVEFVQEYLKGKTVWSDWVEKSDGWPIGVETITAATLAQVNPPHPAILPAWENRVDIAGRCFPERAYDASAKLKAHKDPCSISIRYLGSRYVLTLLSARSALLPAALDRRLGDFPLHNPAGIDPLGADLQHPQLFHIFNWLESLEILLCFQCWREVAAGALKWLWDQRNTDGLWDFGMKVSKSSHFPLSDDWKKPGNRSLDHSTQVLALTKQFPGN